MDSHEVSPQFVDEIVYAQTGKHLNDLQQGIIEGTLNRQKYSDIAKNYGFTTAHTKEVGYKLWKMLSDIFDEPVDKKNLESVLKRKSNHKTVFGNKITNNIISCSCINFGSEQPNPSSVINQHENSEFEKNCNNSIRVALINKLRKFKLSDEQISEVLELPLGIVKQIDYED
uniref:vWA-MoxR associated protein N-terminal HTH domain-containing protein n=1 Tax=Planktothrix pseudagardhii TaxID=132604 RepID=A0A9W4CH61_9CYAN|nr:hypothetical protein NO713_01349 [Planktothrix pseudagardhii]